MPYPFLSDEWIDEARKIRDESPGRAPPVPVPMRMNLVVTEVPFGDGELDAHLDTTRRRARARHGPPRRAPT